MHFFDRYLEEDIYHPPKSRPLPNNGVPAEPYPENAISTISIPKKHGKKEMIAHHEHHRKHTRAETDTDAPEDFHVPQNGGFNIKTNFGYESPYMDPMVLANHH